MATANTVDITTVVLFMEQSPSTLKNPTPLKPKTNKSLPKKTL